jgi:hypothetical protein
MASTTRALGAIGALVSTPNKLGTNLKGCAAVYTSSVAIGTAVSVVWTTNFIDVFSFRSAALPSHH